MHRRIGFGQVRGHGQLDAGGAWQAQVDSILHQLRRPGRSRQGEASAQTGARPFGQLRLLAVIWRIDDLFGQGQRLGIAAQALQHADLPLPRADRAGVAVQRQRRLQLAGALQLLGQAQQQALVALADMRVVGGEITEQLQHLGYRHAGVEGVAAEAQVQVVVDVLAAAKAARARSDRHLLVAKDAQIGQDEFRPGLRQVAEEHQPQAVAQRPDGQAQQTVFQVRAPVGHAARLDMQLAQMRQQFALFQRAARQVGGEMRS